jgi:hypothetical protein
MLFVIKELISYFFNVIIEEHIVFASSGKGLSSTGDSIFDNYDSICFFHFFCCTARNTRDLKLLQCEFFPWKMIQTQSREMSPEVYHKFH